MSTSSSTILDCPLPYVARLAVRGRDAINLVVIHCTELPDMATAREYGERIHDNDSGTGYSGHFYVDRDGALQRHVPVEREAHHTRGYNTRSIGIELVNRGRWPDWFDSRRQVMDEPYPALQIDALISLLQQLRADIPSLAFIAGHEDLDRGMVAASDAPEVKVFRKRDPGPCFPWPDVILQSGLERIGHV